MNSNSEIKSSTNKLDRVIVGLVFIFLISLTNSIFLNQIGYFGALIIILIQFFITKENRFEKTGLEIPFILFLTVELISAIFSYDQSHAFINFSKRLLLIPVVYVVAVTADSNEKAKTFFKVYIGAGLITIALYIIFSYEHFVTQLYRLEARGPSPFQYVMTAGGLMSFSVIFLFSFLINEKTKLANRIFFLIAFGLASIALFASYTRAAWIGAAAGIIFILIMKRKWILIALGAILFFAALIYPGNYSTVSKYELSTSGFTKISGINTDGRASGIYSLRDTVFIADYNHGLSIQYGESEIQNIPAPSPVIDIKKWVDNYFIAVLIDSRLLLMKKDSTGKMLIKEEFIPPGRTVDYKIRNGYLYTADIDSGFSVYTNPNNISESITITSLNGFYSFDVGDTLFACFNTFKNALLVYNLENGIPQNKIDSISVVSKVGSVWINGNNIYLQSEKEFIRFTYENDKVLRKNSLPLIGISNVVFNDSIFYGITLDGKFYEFANDSLSQLICKQIYDFAMPITGFYKDGDAIYLTSVKRNRIQSIFDRYHNTNIERMQQWQTGWKILKDNPLFGVGDIDLKNIYAEYKEYYMKENFGHLHNNYIHFLVILGLFGFVVVMYMLTKIFLLHLRIYRYVKELPFVSSYALGAAAAFVGFLVSGLAEWNFGDQEIITMVWFMLGLNIAFYNNQKKLAK